MRVGDVVLEKYRIDRVLGSGGMGVVVAATDVHDERQVALKLLHAENGSDTEAVARMLREAELSAGLEGRHTGRIVDVARLSGGEPVLVMELLEGEDLARRIARDGPLSASDVIAMVLEACEGLAEAHAKGLVHRDVKPSNLFLVRDIDGSSYIKVIDFGVAKCAPADGQATLTKTASVVGSLPYMSPEQLRSSKAIDARTDVWSLGVVLYELVSGRKPFRAETIPEASIRIATEEPDPLPTSLPADLSSVIARCLQKDPAKRYATVAELAAALAPMSADGHVRSARIARILGKPLPRVPQAIVEPPRARSVRIRDYIANHWLLLALALFVTAMLLLLGSFAVHPQLNEFRIAGTDKRIGYISSFNWTIVHTFLSPLAIGIVGALLAATNKATAALGEPMRRAWDARARNIVVLWLLLSAVLALGYTVVEWRWVFGDMTECNRGGVYLGWPNRLCETNPDVGAMVFMVLAATAQACVLCTSWLIFSTVLWMCELFFGRQAPKLRDNEYARVGRLFGLAVWGWGTLFVALYLARLWSFHLQLTSTSGLLETVFDGFPGSLFEIRAHSQPDVGSMIAGVVMLTATVLPFVLLRLRIRSEAVARSLGTLQRAIAVFGVVSLAAMFFPRIGFFALPAIIVLAVAIPSWRQTLLGAWSSPKTA